LYGEVIAQGIERGEFRPVDVRQFVRVLTAPLVMLTLWNRSFAATGAREPDDERYLAAMIDAFTAALRPDAEEGPQRARRLTGPRQ
jgi:hypothetical protein